jgi:hypothetical protein
MKAEVVRILMELLMTLHRQMLKKLKKFCQNIRQCGRYQERILQSSSVQRYRYANQLHRKNKDKVNLSLLTHHTIKPNKE